MKSQNNNWRCEITYARTEARIFLPQEIRLNIEQKTKEIYIARFANYN